MDAPPVVSLGDVGLTSDSPASKVFALILQYYFLLPKTLMDVFYCLFLQATTSSGKDTGVLPLSEQSQYGEQHHPSSRALWAGARWRRVPVCHLRITGDLWSQHFFVSLTWRAKHLEWSGSKEDFRGGWFLRQFFTCKMLCKYLKKKGPCYKIHFWRCKNSQHFLLSNFTAREIVKSFAIFIERSMSNLKIVLLIMKNSLRTFFFIYKVTLIWIFWKIIPAQQFHSDWFWFYVKKNLPDLRQIILLKC